MQNSARFAPIARPAALTLCATMTFLTLSAVAAPAAPPKTAEPAGPELKTDQDKTLYALGLVISRNLGNFMLTDAELEIVKAGMVDGVLHRPPKADLATWGPKVNEFARSRAATAAAAEKKAGQEFLDKMAAEKGVVKKPSGLLYAELKPGTGPSPKPSDTVKVHYEGTLADGTVFDSSIKRGQPASFELGKVIPCWTEGLQLMKAGGKARLGCPSAIAYGDGGSPPLIKPGAALVFEVELLEIVKK